MVIATKHITALMAAGAAVGAIAAAPAASSAPTGLRICVVSAPGGLCPSSGDIAIGRSVHDVSIRPQGQLPHLRGN
jgi:hypothetical protein